MLRPFLKDAFVCWLRLVCWLCDAVVVQYYDGSVDELLTWLLFGCWEQGCVRHIVPAVEHSAGVHSPREDDFRQCESSHRR